MDPVNHDVDMSVVGVFVQRRHEEMSLEAELLQGVSRRLKRLFSVWILTFTPRYDEVVKRILYSLVELAESIHLRNGAVDPYAVGGDFDAVSADVPDASVEPGGGRSISVISESPFHSGSNIARKVGSTGSGSCVSVAINPSSRSQMISCCLEIVRSNGKASLSFKVIAYPSGGGAGFAPSISLYAIVMDRSCM
jgi:hypothetical protein